VAANNAERLGGAHSQLSCQGAGSHGHISISHIGWLLSVLRLLLLLRRRLVLLLLGVGHAGRRLQWLRRQQLLWLLVPGRSVSRQLLWQRHARLPGWRQRRVRAGMPGRRMRRCWLLRCPDAACMAVDSRHAAVLATYCACKSCSCCSLGVGACQRGTSHASGGHPKV
jgi:hypothetical protein